MKRIIIMSIFIGLSVICTFGQTTEFTFQGSLKDNATAANGNYDFEFALFDMLSGGSQIGATIPKNNVTATNGIFAVKLDFGPVFPGANRFLEIRVRLAGQPGFTTLTPRQVMNSAPYSVKSLNTDNAATAANALQLGGVAANQFVVTTDPRMTDSRSPTAGSANYIQNQNATPQSSSNFNISGTGMASIFSAGTQFNIGTNRILSNAGINNLFAGSSAGFSNTGGGNSFFGAGSGGANQNGGGNSFFGNNSGATNQTGSFNSFFGLSSGATNQTGSFNSFFGESSGVTNQTGSSNSFFGESSGATNQTGSSNSFFGIRSGDANTIGSFNTTIGADADVGANNLSFATAIGSLSVVLSSNTIMIGRGNGNDKVVIPGLGAGGDTALCRNAGNQVATCSSLSVPAGSGSYIQNQNAEPQSSSNFNVSGTGTANIFNATTQYNIDGSRILSNAGTNNLFAGVGTGLSNTGFANSFFGAGSGNVNQAGNFNSFFGTQSGVMNQTGGGNSFFGAHSGPANQTGDRNSFFGSFAGEMTTASDNTFFGYRAGDANTIGFRNTIIGSNANVASGSVANATAIGYRAYVDQGNSIVLGSINGVNGATSDTRVGVGTTAPFERVHVVGNGRIDGNFYVGAASGGGNIGIGTTAPQSRLHVDGTGWFSGDTTPLSGAAGSGVAVGMTGTSGYLFGFDYAAFTPRDLTINQPGGNVGIGVAPSDKLHVGGIIRVDTLGAAGATTLCWNASNQIATCSSSLRYKTNVAKFSQGLSFVNRLNPLSYDWKDGGMKDVGFGAEDIAKIDPRFVTYNEKGEVEGVKYDRLSVAFVNAFKEQQERIEKQQSQIEEQQALIERLEKRLERLEKEDRR